MSNRFEFQRYKKSINNEDGSLSVLILGLFLLLLFISVLIIDIADFYAAKRELIQVAEAGVSVSAHSLDSGRYYLSGSLDSSQLVPIDCQQASNVFNQEISQSQLRSDPIVTDSFICEGDMLSVKIHSYTKPLVAIPLLQSIIGSRFQVTASAGAGSIAK